MFPIRRGTTYVASRKLFSRFVQKRRQNGGLSIPSIVTSSWLSASWPLPPIIPPGIAWLTIPASFVYQAGYGELGRESRCSNIRSRHPRVSRIRSPVGVSEPFGP